MVVLVDGIVEGMVCDLRVGGRVHMDKAIFLLICIPARLPLPESFAVKNESIPWNGNGNKCMLCLSLAHKTCIQHPSSPFTCKSL